MEGVVSHPCVEGLVAGGPSAGWGVGAMDGIDMTSDSRDIPQRIFLDSSTLQTLQDYGGFIYENEELERDDPIRRDPAGPDKLDALRWIMRVAQRAPFQFALSENSFREVVRKNDPRYLQWAHDVLDLWLACLEDIGSAGGSPQLAALVDSGSYGYLSSGDRALLKDAILLGCDTFLTMENSLARNADHIRSTLRIRVLRPIDMWEVMRPWAALFY